MYCQWGAIAFGSKIITRASTASKNYLVANYYLSANEYVPRTRFGTACTVQSEQQLVEAVGDDFVSCFSRCGEYNRKAYELSPFIFLFMFSTIRRISFSRGPSTLLLADRFIWLSFPLVFNFFFRRCPMCGEAVWHSRWWLFPGWFSLVERLVTVMKFVFMNIFALLLFHKEECACVLTSLIFVRCLLVSCVAHADAEMSRRPCKLQRHCVQELNYAKGLFGQIIFGTLFTVQCWALQQDDMLLSAVWDIMVV